MAVPPRESLSGEQLADEPAPQRILSSDVVFGGKVWDVRRDRFAYGEGAGDGNGVEIVREYVDHPGAVAIAALDDEGRMLVLRQYRHPIATRDWELPAGLLDIEGEDPLAAAKRELAEEADLAATDWALLCEFFTSPGGSTELLRVYVARGLTPVQHDFERSEEEADIELRWVAVGDVVAAALESSIRNGILVTAALALAASH